MSLRYPQTKLPFLPRMITTKEFADMQLTEAQITGLNKWFEAHPGEVICRAPLVTHIVPYPVVRIKSQTTPGNTTTPNNNPDQKQSNNSTSAPTPQDDYYVIYPTPLGGGNFGKVFAAYDVTTQCLVAIKLHNIKMQSENIIKKSELLKSLPTENAKNEEQYKKSMNDVIQRLKKETELLASHSESNTNKTSSQYDYRGKLQINEYDVEDIYTVMPLQEGQNLLALALGNQHLSSGRWLHILLNICESLHTLHENIVHRDISLDNILLDPVTGKATITDFGFAVECKRNAVFQGAAVCGKKHHISTEIFDTKAYSQESDIYALGITLTQLLGFLPVKIMKDIEVDALLDVNSTVAKNRIPNTELRKAIFELLTGMLDPVPDLRTSLNAAMTKIKEMWAHCLDATSFLKKIALVDLDEFNNPQKKADIITTLQNGQFDEIQLMNANNQHRDTYLDARKHFEDHNLPIGDFVHQGDAKEIFTTLKNGDNKKSIIEQHFLVSNKESLCGDAKKSDMCFIKIGSSKTQITKTVSDHLEKQLLTPYQITCIKNRLTAEATRLENSYIQRCWLFKRPEANSRINLINIAINSLSQRKTYQDLHRLLTDLAPKMFDIGANLRRKSQGQRNIEKIKTELTSNFSNRKIR